MKKMKQAKIGRRAPEGNRLVARFEMILNNTYSNTIINNTNTPLRPVFTSLKMKNLPYVKLFVPKTWQFVGYHLVYTRRK